MSIVRNLLGIPGITHADLRTRHTGRGSPNTCPGSPLTPRQRPISARTTARDSSSSAALSPLRGKDCRHPGGILRLNVPDGSVLQFILIADDHVNHYIDTYRSLKTRDDELVKKSVDRFGSFLLGGTGGLEKLNNMPIRDFRLIVTFKIPMRQWDGGSPAVAELRSAIFEILGGAHLFPSCMECEDLVRWMRRFFNGKENGNYNDDIPINRQLIFAETP